MLDHTGPVYFRDATVEDVPALVELGQEFFAESEFPAFAEFAPDHFQATLERQMNSPAFSMHLFIPEDEIKGFVAYQLDVSYTKKPMALLWLLYVAPEYRRTPAGRCLVSVATDTAKINGATVFYAGAMSGIPGTGKSLANMYRKFGFEELDYWGRLVL